MEILNKNLYNWASILDEGTRLQAERLSRVPVLAGPVALMPDAHLGIGATVGSVIATEGAVIPAAVGVDLGCGMEAVKTSLHATELPDNLDEFLKIIQNRIPAGVGKERLYVRGSWKKFEEKNPMGQDWDVRIKQKASKQFGTLGSGNHFLEVCLDEDYGVWIVLHSGSRGPGNMLAQGHIRTARKDFRKWTEGNYNLEDPDLAWFLDGTREFNAYIRDMLWAQEYAFGNRAEMMRQATGAFYHFVGKGTTELQISCHHNFCQKEKHGDKEIWVTRKGAISARAGEYGIIPGSMGTKSYIVRGRGNPDSWQSCSHGAGRAMSRNEARKTYTAKDLTKAMGDRVWLKDNAEKLVDEIPKAYKNIDQVMADQQDLVEPEYTLHQILNYKGI
jgi:RNA-splicing ligase RtcB